MRQLGFAAAVIGLLLCVGSMIVYSNNNPDDTEQEIQHLDDTLSAIKGQNYKIGRAEHDQEENHHLAKTFGIVGLILLAGGLLVGFFGPEPTPPSRQDSPSQ